LVAIYCSSPTLTTATIGPREPADQWALVPSRRATRPGLEARVDQIDVDGSPEALRAVEWATGQKTVGRMTTNEPNDSKPGVPRQPARVRRSRTDRVLGGVCAGIAHSIGVDPVLVRIAVLLIMTDVR
jgi:hypothetical protein